ncbi:MAG: tyrosine-type recombinase/integrase [Pseudolabrys sp.]
MRVRLKGINSATKRLADGTRRTYWYAWRGGPLLRGEPGSPEFVASYNEAIATKIAPPKGVLLALLFRFQESAEFQFGISPRTRRDYIKQIKRIERAFGDFPIKALDDPRSTSVFLEWRDKLAQSSLRQADYAYGTLARILSWAKKRRLIAENPCANGGKLYHGSRASKIWHDEEVTRFLQTAPLYLRLAMLLAINTGQRQGDLLRLPWSAYDGATIKLRQRKTGAYVPIPVADALKDALDATKRKSPIMLTNSEGKPWSESGFQGAWGKATTRAGIRGLTFHDLRGTAVVTLARAGCTEVEIYAITGHKPGDVQAILTAHYLPRDAEVAGNAIAKLNQYKSRGDQKEDEKLQTAHQTTVKIVNVKTEKP